jgi:hypothetical protein
MEPQLFAIVNWNNHGEVYCYGFDLGEYGAYVVRCDRMTGQMAFSTWSSPESAYRRFSHALRHEVKLHLIVLDRLEELSYDVEREVYPELFDDPSDDTSPVHGSESMSNVGHSG